MRIKKAQMQASKHAKGIKGYTKYEKDKKERRKVMRKRDKTKPLWQVNIRKKKKKKKKKKDEEEDEEKEDTSQMDPKIQLSKYKGILDNFKPRL